MGSARRASSFRSLGRHISAHPTGRRLTTQVSPAVRGHFPQRTRPLSSRRDLRSLTRLRGGRSRSPRRPMSSTGRRDSRTDFRAHRPMLDRTPSVKRPVRFGWQTWAGQLVGLIGCARVLTGEGGSGRRPTVRRPPPTVGRLVDRGIRGLARALEIALIVKGRSSRGSWRPTHHQICGRAPGLGGGGVCAAGPGFSGVAARDRVCRGCRTRLEPSGRCRC
jgi:hypothetical protein